MYLPGCGQIQASYYGIHDQAPTSTPEEALLINNNIRARAEKFLHSHNIETWEDLENLNWATIEHYNYGLKTHEAWRQVAPIDIPPYKDLEKMAESTGCGPKTNQRHSLYSYVNNSLQPI